LVISNPTLPEITDGYEIQLHHSMGHDPLLRVHPFIGAQIGQREHAVCAATESRAAAMVRPLLLKFSASCQQPRS